MVEHMFYTDSKFQVNIVSTFHVNSESVPPYDPPNMRFLM